MPTTVTRTQVRQEMLRRAPILGKVLTADSFTKAGPSVTQVAEYYHQRSGLTQWQGYYIHRYNLSDPDRWRIATTLDTGATNGILNVDGPSYINSADLAYERLTVHPDDLNYAIAEGQRRQRVRTNIALVRNGFDLDMEAANTASWNGTNATLTKTASAFSGTQSLAVSGTGANPTVNSGSMRVTPQRLAFFACIVHPNVGNITFYIYDPVNASTLGSVQMANPYGAWALMYLQLQIPSNCTSIQYRWTSTNAAAAFLVDTCFGPYQSGQTEYELQTALDEAYKLRFVRPSKFISPQQTAGICDADSLSYMGDLTNPEDWDMEVFRRDINSNRLRFQPDSYNNRNIGWGYGGFSNTGLFMQNNQRPIWLAMEAKVSDFEPLLTESSTTSQPLDECACYSLRYIAETMTQRDPRNVVWQNMLTEYKMWSVVEDQGRPPQAMYTPQRYHHTLA